MKDRVHIAVCLDNEYVMPTGVLMYSACVNNQDVDIDFHVLIDESVNEEEQKDLKDTISRFHGKRAIFYALKSMTALSFPLVKKHLTRAAYYRLFLSDILPSAIEKVLYLDGDIIVRHSLLPLWNADVSNYAAGTVMDVCDGDIKIYNRLPNWQGVKSGFDQTALGALGASIGRTFAVIGLFCDSSGFRHGFILFVLQVSDGF